MNDPLPPTVLIDDDPDVLASLGEVLRAWPCPKVVCHTSPWDAGADAREAGLVICDYRFPGVSGVEWVREFRGHGFPTPVLLLSGAPDREGVWEAASLGACHFLQKPFSIGQLEEAVGRLLEAGAT